MPLHFTDDLEKKIAERLRYYDDLGIRLFYKERSTPFANLSPAPTQVTAAAASTVSSAQRASSVAPQPSFSSARPSVPPLRPALPTAPAPASAFLPRPAGPS